MLQNRAMSMLHNDFARADINHDGIIDEDEFGAMAAANRQRVSRVGGVVQPPSPTATGGISHGGTVNLFDTVAHKTIKHQKALEVRAVQDALSDGVWIGGSPELFKHALGVARILEGVCPPPQLCTML